MIPKSAIRAFLKRKTDTHLWVKDLKRKELLAELDALMPRPYIPKETWLHQLACFLLGVAYPRFSFWLDMGTGKTFLTLLLLAYWRKCGKLRRALVFVISDKAFSAWEKPFKRFNIPLSYVTLEGSSEEKWRALDEFEDGVVIVTYPGAVAMIHERKKGKRKKKYVIDDKKLKRMMHRVDALVMDESTRAGGRDSLTNSMCIKIARKVDIVYALAGRPFGRDPTLLWVQQYIVDLGETLGETLGLFRKVFFTEKDSYWGGPYSKEYTFNKKMKGELSRVLQHRSVTYAADECIEMPKVVPIVEELSFPGEAQSYYKKVVAAIRASRGNLRETESAFIRLRQLSSGFLGMKDDETGERTELAFDHNPKLDWTLDKIESLPEGRKVVVFYEFTWSGRRIVEELKARKIKCIWLWAGTKNSRKELERFFDDEECVVAVAQNKVAAYSIDGLQDVANYGIFYESPVSPIDREQAERRLARAGQKRRVFLYDPIVRGSSDARILAFHKEGNDLMKALLREPTLAFDEKEARFG